MDPVVRSYRRRLDTFSTAVIGLMGAVPFVLGTILAGWEWALLFLVMTTGLGLFRTRGKAALPGTVALEEWQAPGLFALIESLARRARLKQVPEVRVVPGGPINAAAMLRGNTPVLVLTENLLGALDSRRLGAVLAHETAHLHHRDLFVFRLAFTFQAASIVLAILTFVLAVITLPFNPTVAIAALVLSLVAPPVSRWLFALLSRTREFAADLGSAVLTGDPASLADSLEAVEYRAPTLWERLTGRRGPQSAPAEDAFRTHPATSERVRRLDWLARRWQTGRWASAL